MLKYSQNQQGYYSPTHPGQLSGNDVKGKPVNGPKEWTYPIITYVDDQMMVQKAVDITKEGAVITVKQYLAP